MVSEAICHLLCTSSHGSVSARAACECAFMTSLSHCVCSFLSAPNRWFVRDKSRTTLWPWFAGACTRVHASHVLAPSTPHLIKRMNQVKLDPAGGNRKVSCGVYRQIEPWTLSSLFPAEESGEIVFMSEMTAFAVCEWFPALHTDSFMCYFYSLRNKRMQSSRTLCSLRRSEPHFSQDRSGKPWNFVCVLIFPNKQTRLTLLCCLATAASPCFYIYEESSTLPIWRLGQSSEQGQPS